MPRLERVAVVLRSGGVGVLATGVDLVTLALLTAFGVPPRIASVPALVLGVAVQFGGNKWLAFRDRSSQWGSQAIRFAAIEAFAFFANLALFDLLVGAAHLPWFWARLMSTSFVYFVICLPAWFRIFTTTERAT